MPGCIMRVEESLDEHELLVRAGLVRYIAMSNHSIERITEAEDVARTRGFSPPVVGQQVCNLPAGGLEDEFAQCTAHLSIADLIDDPLAC